MATATAVVTATTSGAAVAAIPAADGTIKGCYANVNSLLLGIPHSKGDARIVDENEGCRSYETTLKWNQTGPRGPAGPTGATGAAGAPGISSATVAQGEVSNVLNVRAFTKVTSRNLPAGSWAIVATAKMTLSPGPFGGDTTITTDCHLRNGAGFIGGATDRRSTPSDEAGLATLSMNGAAQLAEDGEVSVWCSSRGSVEAVVQMRVNAQMLIMQVGSFF